MPDIAQLIAAGDVEGLAREHLPTYLGLAHQSDRAARLIPRAHHLRMVRHLEGEGHRVVTAPRGAAKTTIVQSLVERRLGAASLEGGKDWAERVRVLYLSHAAHKAYSVSLAVMNSIQAPVYRALFPKVVPSEVKWSQEEWRLRGNERTPHANFVAAGIDSPPLGGRFDLIILDDIADQENMATAGQREKVCDTLNQTVLPMLTPWGQVLMLCTRWAWGDPRDWAVERGFSELLIKALTWDGAGKAESYWPERFSVPYLEELRAKDARSFAKQYQNEVAPEEGLVFERWWFERRFDLLPADLLFRLESWDLAAGTGKRRSYSVGQAGLVARSCPLCQGAPWHIFLPHMFRGQLGYGYLKVAIRECYQLMGGYSQDHYAVIEKKSVGEALAGEGLTWRGDDGELYGVPLRFRSAVGEGQARGVKEKYIADVADICRQGRVHLPSERFLRESGARSAGWVADWEREVFSYPDGETDDVVSAFVQLVLEVEERRRIMQRLLDRRRPVPQFSQDWQPARVP